MSSIFDMPLVYEKHCRTGQVPCFDPNCEDEDHIPGELVDPCVAEPDPFLVTKVPPVSKIVYKSESRAHNPRCWQHMRWEFILHSTSTPSLASPIDQNSDTFGNLTPFLRMLKDHLRAEDAAQLIGPIAWLAQRY